MVRAAIYARFSCDKQRDASIDDQLYECGRYADAHGYEVVANYCDYAMSGRSDDRPQFLKMIEDAKARLFDVILVWKVDRFARNMSDHFYYEHILTKAGVVLESICEHVTGRSIEATTNKAMTTLFAQMRSESSAEDAMRGMLGKARKCQYLGYVRYGYGHDGDVITVNEQEAEVVRQLHDRYLAGESMRDLGQWLIDDGLKSFKSPHAAELFVHRVLKAEYYTGVYQWGKEKDEWGNLVLDETGSPKPLVRVEDGMPAIVSREVKDRVWERMNFRKKYHYEIPYDLTGKIYCSACGNPLHGVIAYGKSKTYRYYACKSKQRTCFGSVSKEALEGSIATAVRAIVGDDETKGRLADLLCGYKEDHGNEATLKAARRDQRDVERQIDNLVRAVQEGLPWELAKERLAALESRKDGIGRRVADLEAEQAPLDRDDVLSFLGAIEAGYATDSELLRAFVGKSWLFEGRAVATLNMSGYDASLQEIEAKIEEPDASPQLDGVRPSLRWCPTNTSARTPLIVIPGVPASVFALDCGLGILVNV